jgi:hypothetical protein
MLTIIETCRKQERNVLQFVTQIIGQASPTKSLLT